MSVRCAASGCTNTKENSGRIFARCKRCETWWCSKHGTAGNRCPGCGYKYLSGYSSSGGGCFVTTATILSLGKKENCKELNAFRYFRDGWLLYQADGKKLIKEYYSIAPQIVEAIEKKKDKKKIYNDIWSNHLSICLDLIESGKFIEAKEVYENSMMSLKNKYLS